MALRVQLISCSAGVDRSGLVVLAPDAGVRVVPDAVLLPAPRVLLPGARRREEPQAVVFDRSAERDRRVVVADERIPVADFGMIAVVLREPRTAEQPTIAQVAIRVVVPLRVGQEVVAANRLPPVRGMMLIDAPPVSDSPSAPEICTLTSWAFATSAT